MSLLENFIKYVKIDTQSDDTKDVNPTTSKQFELGNLLVNQLKELGITNAFIDEHCYVYAFIEGTNPDKTIGLIAHLDTALEMSGKGVKPNIIKDYDGGIITLNKELGITMSPVDFPSLNNVINHTIITTDGTTLLGADDKAGVAIIMEIAETLMENKQIKHPNIIITFTPDEEVGMGTNSFNYDFYKSHGCNVAYTLDGGDIEEINYENFNAASCLVEIFGKSIHPGSAKGKMINSIKVAMEFDSLLPKDMVPEKTENYEGFNHLNDIEGGVESTTMHYIIRNHDMNIFNKQKDDFLRIKDVINKKYGSEIVKVTITDSYYNMKELVLKNKEVIEYPKKALISLGYTPKFIPIRGGTDGARLSFNGIITPNLGTGGENYHGKFEYVSLDNMKKMVTITLKMLELIACCEK